MSVILHWGSLQFNMLQWEYMWLLTHWATSTCHISLLQSHIRSLCHLFFFLSPSLTIYLTSSFPVFLFSAVTSTFFLPHTHTHWSFVHFLVCLYFLYWLPPPTSLKQCWLFALCFPLHKHYMLSVMGCKPIRMVKTITYLSLLALTHLLSLFLALSDCAEDEDPGPETTVSSLAGHQQSTYQIEKHIPVWANTHRACFQNSELLWCWHHCWPTAPQFFVLFFLQFLLSSVWTNILN